MNPLEKLRIDALRGKWLEVLKTYEKESALRREYITATGDTALHLAVSSGKEKVVEKMVDLLVEEKRHAENDVVVTVDEDGEASQNVNIILSAKNDKNNTPLHLAAIRGNIKMCIKIGRTDPSLIAKRNKMGETPLFLAALHGSKEAFLWLHYLYVRGSSTNFDFAHCIRDNKDTILHCAIAEGHVGVAIEIVHLYKDCMREMMNRNEEGLSPLHLLASKPSAFASTALLKVPILLRLIYALWRVKEKNHATTLEELSQEAVIEGYFLLKFIKGIRYLLLIPLFLLGLLLFTFSEAALQRWLHDIPKMKKRHTWWHQIMTELHQHASNEDMSEIILRNASEQLSLSLLRKEHDYESESGTQTIETPLMIAVKNGVVEMVEEILKLFPSTIYHVNADERNILLLAVEYRQEQVFRFLCKQEWLTESLSWQVDKDGNNALHLAARLKPDWLIPSVELSLQRELNWFESVKISMPHNLLERYNKQMETPEDIFRESHKDLMISEAGWVAKTSEACSVVSTLVVSVAFATRTSVPGGYEGDNGYAILRNKPQAFKTFREFSFAALFFSLISTICFLSIVASRSLRYVPSRFYCGVYFMFSSIVCLWISFCAADFFMLHDDTQKLHKALPTYIWLTFGIILMVLLQLPTFFSPKLHKLQREVVAFNTKLWTLVTV